MGLFRNKSAKVPEIAVNSQNTENQIQQPQPMPAPEIQEYPKTQSPPPQQIPQSTHNPVQQPQPTHNPIQTPQQIPQPEPKHETIMSASKQMPSSSILQMPKPTSSESMMSQGIPTVTSELSMEEKSSFNDEQPFFVRIDKFSETKENFISVLEKVGQMEKVLESLELTKEEEEKEIEEWKNDIKEMRTYLSSIDKEIFSKI